MKHHLWVFFKNTLKKWWWRGTISTELLVFIAPITIDTPEVLPIIGNYSEPSDCLEPMLLLSFNSGKTFINLFSFLGKLLFLHEDDKYQTGLYYVAMFSGLCKVAYTGTECLGKSPLQNPSFCHFAGLILPSFHSLMKIHNLCMRPVGDRGTGQ